MKENCKLIRGTLVAFLSLNVLSLHANASEHLVDIPRCPQYLNVQQNIEPSTENGWKPVNTNKRHRLYSIGFSAGEYPGEGFLIPDDRKLLPTKETYFYDHLSPIQIKNKLIEHWAICSYTETSAVLIRKLPENVVHCEVESESFELHDVFLRCFDNEK
jgi:hypothetical protein